jgi:hypothetical protein
MADVPAASSLPTTWAMSQGARNCPFFTLTARPVSAAATSRSVCRQRKAGICSTSTASARARLRRLVNVGNDRAAEPLADLGKNRQRGLQSDATHAFRAGPVGLVERAFVDQPDAELGRHLAQGIGHFDGVGPPFHGARPGDQRQWQVVADSDGTDGDVAGRAHAHPPPSCPDWASKPFWTADA